MHIATSPPPSNGALAGSAPRQLRSDPLTVEKQAQQSAVNAFRAQISPKKSVFRTNLSSTPVSSSTPFAVQPGFSMTDHSSLATRQFTDFPSASQPTSPFKPKSEPRASLYPSPASQASSTAVPIPVMTPQLSQPDLSDANDTSNAQDASVFTSTTSGPSLDVSILLQEELLSSRQYALNLERQCDLLRDQVHMLQSQITRQSVEMASLRHQLEQSSHQTHPTSTMHASHQQSPATATTGAQQRPRPVMAAPSPVVVEAPVVEHSAAMETDGSDELRDSIETSSDEGIANPKKRSRTYEAEGKPGLAKRLSFETTTSPIATAAPAPAEEEVQNLLETSVDDSDVIAALEQFESRRDQNKTSVGAVTLPLLSRHTTPASSQAPLPTARTLSFDKMTQGSAAAMAGEQGTPPNSPSPSQGSASEETLHASKPTSPISHSIAIITQLQEEVGTVPQ